MLYLIEKLKQSSLIFYTNHENKENQKKKKIFNKLMFTSIFIYMYKHNNYIYNNKYKRNINYVYFEISNAK